MIRFRKSKNETFIYHPPPPHNPNKCSSFTILHFNIILNRFFARYYPNRFVVYIYILHFLFHLLINHSDSGNILFKRISNTYYEVFKKSIRIFCDNGIHKVFGILYKKYSKYLCSFFRVKFSINYNRYFCISSSSSSPSLSTI